MWELKKLKLNQKLFVEEYLGSYMLNATEAYMKAYPHCHSREAAAASASRLLRHNRYVKAYWREFIEEITHRPFGT